MKLKIYKKLILITILINTRLCGDQIITFFFKPFPVNDEKTATERAQKIGKLGKLPKYTLRATTQNYYTSGIFTTYAGYLGISDLNGQVLYPRKHADPKITIVVTKHIFPILMLENTVHHWEISDRERTSMYEIERKLDMAAKTYFWDVKQIEVPADNILPRDSITIIAKPDHVYIPSGITITTKSPQLVLPDIYVKRGIEKLTNTLYIFGLKNLLTIANSAYKKGKQSYSQKIAE